MKTSEPSDDIVLAAAYQRFGRERPLTLMRCAFEVCGGVEAMFALAMLKPDSESVFSVLVEDSEKSMLLAKIKHPFLAGRCGEG